MRKNNLNRFLQSIFIITLCITICCNKDTLYAASYNVVIDSKDILKVGESVTITIDINEVVGKVDIKSTNEKVISSTSVWVENSKKQIELPVKSTGKTTITVIASDVSNSIDGDNLSFDSKTLNVIASSGVKGDISGDSKTDLIDVFFTYNLYLKGDEIEQGDLKLADMDNNGRVDLLDVFLVYNLYIKNIL